MKGVVDRITLFFKGGWQWLTAEPGYRGALLCGLSAIGAMIMIGYSGSKGIFSPPATAVQTSDVVAARISAMSDQLGASSAKNSALKNGIGDEEVIEASPAGNDSRSRKESPSPSAIASDKSFFVAETEKKKAAIPDSGEVKKSASKSTKKTQRRVERQGSQIQSVAGH